MFEPISFRASRTPSCGGIYLAGLKDIVVESPERLGEDGSSAASCVRS